MSSTLIRAQVRARLADDMQDLLGPGVQVSRSFPGKLAKAEMVWCNGITGDIEQPFAMTGRQARYDVFRMTWMFSAGLGGRTEDQNSTRAQEMFTTFEDLIIENADGLLFDDLLCEVTLSALDGPNTWVTDQGHNAILEATVEARSYHT
jgi:hypothetical protein